jgi:hypothetical protein
MSLQETETHYIAPELCARFGGHNDSWPWRLLMDEDVNFPRAIRVRGPGCVRLSELEKREDANCSHKAREVHS